MPKKVNEFTSFQRCTPLLLVNHDSPQEPTDISFKIRKVELKRKQILRCVWETGKRKNYREIIELCEDAMVKMNSLKPKEEKKEQRRMPKELRGLSQIAKTHILKDLQILKYYLIHEQKDYNIIKIALKTGLKRIKRVVEGYLKTGKLPLSYARSRFKTPENVFEFMENYFNNRDNVFKKISNLQKDIYDHPNFGQHKMGYFRARKIIRKAGIRWKRTWDVRKNKKETDEPKNIIFKKCKEVLEAIMQDDENTFF